MRRGSARDPRTAPVTTSIPVISSIQQLSTLRDWDQRRANARDRSHSDDSGGTETTTTIATGRLWRCPDKEGRPPRTPESQRRKAIAGTAAMPVSLLGCSLAEKNRSGKTVLRAFRLISSCQALLPHGTGKLRITTRFAKGPTRLPTRGRPSFTQRRAHAMPLKRSRRFAHLPLQPLGHSLPTVRMRGR